jgi:propionyl-CoA synthetase
MQSLGLKKEYSRNLYAHDSPSSFAMLCMCKNWATHWLFLRFVLAWIGNQDRRLQTLINYNRLFGIEIDRLITYKPLVDEAIELIT